MAFFYNGLKDFAAKLKIITNMNELAKSMNEYNTVRDMSGVGDRLAPLLIAELEI